MKNYIRFIGIFIFLFILWSIDLTMLIQIIKNINFKFFIISILLNIPQLLTKSIRWNLLLKKQGINYSLFDSFMIFLNGLYLGIITPGRLGEFIRVVYMKQDKGISFSKGFSSVITDRLFDLYLLIILAAIGTWYFGLLGAISNIFIFLLVFIILAPFVVLNKKIMNYIILILYKVAVLKKNKIKIEESFDDFYRGINQLIGYNLFVSIILTIISYIIFFIQCYFITLAMDLSISFLDITLFMAISNIVSFIPITISGLGTRDAILILLFSLVGIDSEFAVVYSFLVFIVFFVSGGALGFISWSINPLKQGFNIKS